MTTPTPTATTGTADAGPAKVEYAAEKLALDAGVRWRDLTHSGREVWREHTRSVLGSRAALSATAPAPEPQATRPFGYAWMDQGGGVQFRLGPGSSGHALGSELAPTLLYAQHPPREAPSGGAQEADPTLREALQAARDLLDRAGIPVGVFDRVLQREAAPSTQEAGPAAPAAPVWRRLTVAEVLDLRSEFGWAKETIRAIEAKLAAKNGATFKE